MSKINIDNYEAFYLDYLEGNLSVDDIALLVQFLEDNPDIKTELEDFKIIELSKKQDSQFDKELLLQNINESNVEEYIIASIENEIDEDDAKDLGEYLNKNNDAKILANRYGKTILQKRTIFFPEKNKLLKRSPATYYLVPLLSAAAIALLVILINPFLKENYNTISSSVQIANKITDTLSNESPIKENVIIASDVKSRIYPEHKNNIPEIEKETNLVQIEENPIIIEDKQIQQDLLALDEHENTIDTIIDYAVKPITNEEVAVNTIDTVTTDVKDEIPELLADNTTNNNIEELKLREWLNRTIRKKVLNKEKATKDKIEGNEILAAVVEKIDENSKTNLAYNYFKNSNSSSYSLSIGRFEFSRTKN